jgi:fibronectin-binding autotransporter adhesin
MANYLVDLDVNGVLTGAHSPSLAIVGGGVISDSGNLTLSSASTAVQVASGINLTAVGGASAFDFSAASGAFKSSTGAVTIGTGALTVSASTSSFSNALYAEGGIDRSGATTLSLGGTNATAVSIGRSGQTTTIAGPLSIASAQSLSAVGGASNFDFSASSGTFKTSTGAVTIGTGALTVSASTSTFNNALYANGGLDRSAAATLSIGTTNATAITLGKSGATIAMTGDVSGNLSFTKAANHTIFVQNSTATGGSGGTLNITGGQGGPSGGLSGQGSLIYVTAGQGGNAVTTHPAGVGGDLNFYGGAGGTGLATASAGAGGNTFINAGAGGIAAGGGIGVGGSVYIDAGVDSNAAPSGQIIIGQTDATIVSIGNSTNITQFNGVIQQQVQAAFTGSNLVMTTAAVQTTNATVTTIYTLTPANNTAYWIMARIIGRNNANNGDHRYAIISAMVSVDAAGSPALSSVTTIASATAGGASGWGAPSMSVSGSNLLVTVTGVAATTVNWVARIEYQAISGSA